MDVFKFILSKLCATLLSFMRSLRHQLRLAWRLAFQDPTPAWKKKGVVHGPGKLFDLALLVSVVCLGLISWLW